VDCRLEPLFSRSGFVLGPGKRGALCRYAEKSKHLRDKTLLRGEYSRCSPIAEMREGSQGGIELMFRGRDFGTRRCGAVSLFRPPVRDEAESGRGMTERHLARHRKGGTAPVPSVRSFLVRKKSFLGLL
jgi:hypothetical protein